jgi:hypothetical protein
MICPLYLFSIFNIRILEHEAESGTVVDTMARGGIYV